MKSWQKTLTLVLSAALATSVALFVASCGGENESDDTSTTYTVTYAFGSCEEEPYAGTSALPTETAKAEGAKFNVAAAPVWEGYTFKGWNDGTTVVQAEAEYTMPAKNVTFTGTWEVAGSTDTVKLPDELYGTNWTYVVYEKNTTEYLTHQSINIVDETHIVYNSNTAMLGKLVGTLTSYDENTGVLNVDFEGTETALTWNSATQKLSVLLDPEDEPIVFNQLIIPESLSGDFASKAAGWGGAKTMTFGGAFDPSYVQLTMPGLGGDQSYVGSVVSVVKQEGGGDGSVVSYTVLVVVTSTGDEENVESLVFEFDYTSEGILNVYEDNGGSYLDITMQFYPVFDAMPEAFCGNWSATIDGEDVKLVITEEGATFTGNVFTNPEVTLITSAFFVIEDDPSADYSTLYTFEYTARPESFTTNAGKEGDEVKFYKEGSVNAPFKWTTVDGAHEVDLPDGDLNLPVYIEFTADKDANYLVDYANAFKDMQFTLNEKGGSIVASWSVKERPADAPDGIYPFPLKNGTTYVLKLLNGNAAGKLNITFTVTTTIPSDYHGTWTDKAADPTYTVTVTENKITVNSTEITSFTLGAHDSGWSFTWEEQTCTIKFIQQLSSGTETIKKHLEFTVDDGKAVQLYQAGDHPAVSALGSLKNPEFVEQSALATSYSKEVASGTKYYYAVEATENALYKLSTTVDNLKITIANLEDDGTYAVGDTKLVTWADSAETKSQYFELSAGTTYVIVVENANAETSTTVSFKIETTDDVEDPTLVPKDLRTTFVGKTNKALSFTFTALTWQATTTPVLSGMDPTKWSGSVVSVDDSSDASTVISLVAASTGSEFTATYDKSSKELTFTYSGGKTEVYVSETGGGDVVAWDGTLPDGWQGTYIQKDFGAQTPNMTLVIEGNKITITASGAGLENVELTITAYDDNAKIITFSTADGSVVGTIERAFTWDTDTITNVKVVYGTTTWSGCSKSVN